MFEAFKEFLGIASNVEAFYWITAILATGMFIVKMVLSSLGADHDFDIDADIPDDVDFDADHHFLSFDAILFFFKALGWIGVICYSFTKFAPLTIFAISLGSGILTFFLAAYALAKMRNLESSGTLDLRNAIGKVGTVYLSIPANAGGSGQIQIPIQGRLETLDAKSPDDSIRTGQKVLVYDVKDNVLLVSPYKEQELI